jgi:dipeptide/tripeptide permease
MGINLRAFPPVWASWHKGRGLRTFLNMVSMVRKLALGFGAAGVGMTLGLVQYLLGRKRLTWKQT